MNIPYNGKVNMRLVTKRFKGVQFWSINQKPNGFYQIQACILKPIDIDTSTTDHADFINIDKNFKLDCWSNWLKWADVYDSYSQAQKIVKEYNDLIKKFDFIPFLKINIIKKHFDTLMLIQNKIHEKLSNYENFQGIDFCDVSANGIQIRGHHKQIEKYTYGTQPTIKYDFSNIEKVIKEFVEMWQENDTPEKMSAYKRFIYFGEKYDWN